MSQRHHRRHAQRRDIAVAHLLLQLEHAVRVARLVQLLVDGHTHYTDQLIVETLGQGPSFSAIVDDVYFGARLHVWPVHWLRFGLAFGGDAHREYDDTYVDRSSSGSTSASVSSAA